VNAEASTGVLASFFAFLIRRVAAPCFTITTRRGERSESARRAAETTGSGTPLCQVLIMKGV
jgi:hypothetical protein